jgi:hypothetical protein
MQKCTYCQMNNHTTEACGKIKHAESHTHTSNSNKWTCYHSGLTGHLKANCIHFKRAWDQRNMVNNGTASASIATAGDRDLIRLAENATPLTAATAPAVWVIYSGASHHMWNDPTRFNSITILRQPIVI